MSSKMPKASPKHKKELSKSKATSKSAFKAKKPSPSPPPADSSIDEDEEPNFEDDSEGDEDTDSEDEGIDQEGMERLMKALGDDTLNGFDRAQLDALVDEGSDEEGENSEAESGEDEEEVDWEDVHDGEDDEDEGLSDEDDVDEEEEDIALDEVDDVELDQDLVPRQKVEIDNTYALQQIRESIKLDSALPWTESLTLSYPQTIEVDVNDDLNRELAFYKQALHSTVEARNLAATHKFPFSRPPDYFAEMVKSDSHMERIRQRLLNESATIKSSEDKRKEREGKKFGKQVQIEKLKEREKSKKEMEERLNGLKRKRKDVLDNAQAGEEDFDIAVEDAISDRPAKKSRSSTSGPPQKNLPRSARDQKFGFGGSKRHSKQNTRESTDDFGSGRGGRGSFGKRGSGGPPRGGRGGSRGGGRGGGGRGGGGRGGGHGDSGGRGGSRGGGGGGAKRPGKSRREASRSRQ